MSVTSHQSRDWKSAVLMYMQPKSLSMMLLGFSAGLPFLLVFSTLSAWLRDEAIELSTIGFFSWIGITYSVKFFWAPIIDRLPLPFLTSQLGHRRSWILFGQLGVVCGLIGMALTSPQLELFMLTVFALVIAFSSATQDVSIDAYRIEIAEPELQGIMAAAYVLGYRLALLVAGAGAFYIAEYTSWSIAYLIMSICMLAGIVTTLCISEPVRQISHDTWQQEQRVIDFLEQNAHWPQHLRMAAAWIIGAIVCPFVDFFVRYGKTALIILLLIGLYRISDITMGVMANPFYLDMGYSKEEIASVGKIFGFFMTIFGSMLGGILVARFGIAKPLLLGAVLVAVTNLLFAWLALQSADIKWLALVISADNLSGGLAAAAFIAYLSSLTSTAYTATQYALFSSLMTLPAKILGGFSGVVVELSSYSLFFIYAALIGVPAILLILFLMHDQLGSHASIKRRR